MLWLAIFFVVPLVFLFMTSLQTPVPGGEVGQFQQTFSFMPLLDTLTDDTYLRAVDPLVRLLGIATILALLSDTRWPMRSPSRAGKHRNLCWSW